MEAGASPPSGTRKASTAETPPKTQLSKASLPLFYHSINHNSENLVALYFLWFDSPLEWQGLFLLICHYVAGIWHSIVSIHCKPSLIFVKRIR